jgi:hypothetical protein
MNNAKNPGHMSWVLLLVRQAAHLSNNGLLQENNG